MPDQLCAKLGLKVIERDWLSSNSVVFSPSDCQGAAVVDTGYCKHSALTVRLVEEALDGQPLSRIVNTHLHSDHCGGNASLQARYAAARTLVPRRSLDAVTDWDPSRLSFVATGQSCPVFAADLGLSPGQIISLGTAEWQIHPCPGHDPDALMLYEPDSRTLIAGDALWEAKTAIIFPELVGESGFTEALATLDLIEQLDPRWVIPGHGSPFDDVASALSATRQRIQSYRNEPDRHPAHAARALCMFHMLECESVGYSQLIQWLSETPLFATIQRQIASCRSSQSANPLASWAQRLIEEMIESGLLSNHGGQVAIARDRHRPHRRDD